MLDAAIVGAGLAGLTAARDLARSGLDSFVVIEARDRVRRADAESADRRRSRSRGRRPMDRADTTAVMNLARILKLRLSQLMTTAGRSILSRENGPRSSRRPTLSAFPISRRKSIRWRARFRLPIHGRLRKRENTTLQRSLNGSIRKGSHPRIEWASISGSASRMERQPSRSHSCTFLYYARSAGGFGLLESIRGGAQDSRIVGGAQLLSLKMADQLGSHVTLSSPVTKISNWAGGSGPVVIETGRAAFEARRVVVALMPSLAAQITFDPPLPQQRLDLQNHWPTHGTGMKVHLSLSKALLARRRFERAINHSAGTILLDRRQFPSRRFSRSDIGFR